MVDETRVLVREAVLDGIPVAVTGGTGDGTVRVWDLTSSTPLGQPMTGHAPAGAALSAHLSVLRAPRSLPGPIVVTR